MSELFGSDAFSPRKVAARAAVWMAIAGRSVINKAVAIVFPISAFVAAGFEHSVANTGT